MSKIIVKDIYKNPEPLKRNEALRKYILKLMKYSRSG